MRRLAAATASGLSSSKFCGTAAYMGVNVNSHTSCRFANAITRKHLKSSAHRVSAYNAAAHRTITMRCHVVWTSDSPYTTCAGGTHARLWITS